MEDCILSIITKIAEYAVAPLLHHAQYLCCFNNFAGNLPNAKRELELTRDSVKERVKEATNKTEKIEPTVEKWLKDVENVLAEVQKLEGRITEARKSFFRRQCQYFLAKEIARKTEKMSQLNRNSKFEPFSRLIELPGMLYYSSKTFILFKSLELTYNMLLETLKDKNVRMIGLHGIGGSGKTTLVKEVCKKAEELQLYEKFVIATVSQTPNIRSIQAQIADQLGLQLVEESDIGRAQRLSQRLREGTTLVVLDDVWEKLDFEALGIPLNENNKGSGVLLTTRSRKVCTSMQCQSIIELSLLTQEEAWTLFKFYASITDDSPDSLKVVARKVVNECKGLPIAIVTVGSTLKGKTSEEWELALSRLEDSRPLDIPKGLRSPYICLQLSYDNLTNELAKSLFLLCPIFPEDHEIDLEDLFRFGKGLGLTGTSGRMEKARREMHVAVNMLLDSCLLLHTNKKEKVKMHDMVRDVALWIASERGQAILVSSKMDLTALAEDETIKDKRAISFWDLNNDQFLHDQFNCPTLDILLLHSPESRLQVSRVFFERMKMLKILAFLKFDFRWLTYPIQTLSESGSRILPLPVSTESLKNLQTLCLRGFHLVDISILESLQGLEILDLRGSSFNKLPNGIVALKKLKLLDIFECWIKENNTYEMIGRCLQLEELYFCSLTSTEKLPYNFSLSRLQRYVIIQRKGYGYRTHMRGILGKHRPSRALYIPGFNASAQTFTSLSIKDLFVRAEYLHLRQLQGGYKNLIPAMDQQGMNQLIILVLQYCPEIECLIECTNIANTNVNLLQTKALSGLVKLMLLNMDGLQEVFRDPSSQCCLKNLEELNIENCCNLYNISFPRNSKLRNLKILIIESCPRLACLFIPSIGQTLELLEELRISECSKLKNVIEGNVDCVSNQSHSSFVLQKLRILDIEKCESLEYIFPVLFAQGLGSLQMLRIEDCCKLKYVFGTEKEHQPSTYHHHNHHDTNIEINLLNLGTLTLYSLSNLVGIWPEFCHPRLQNLKELNCIRCPRLSISSGRKVGVDSDIERDTTTMEKGILWPVATTINQRLSPEFKAILKLRELRFTDLGVESLFQFQMEELGINTEQGPFNMDLDILSLYNLPELKFIFKGPTNFLSLQMITDFYVSGCSKLKTIFSPSIVRRSFPVLFKLRIYRCEELEQIFDSGDAQELKSSQQVCFPDLRLIDVTHCNKLKCLFDNFTAGHFPRLRSLEIQECSQVEKAFAFEHEVDEGGRQGIDKDGEQASLLPNLESITLKKLPNFKEIHHGLELKNVKLNIEDCPKYNPRA